MLSHLVISLGFLVTATDGFILGCLKNNCQHQCVNVVISIFGYECRCYSGYSVDPSHSNKCVPNKPSCGRGYQNSASSPYSCVDFDECSSGSSPCEQKCRNSQGSYECSCNSGYVVSARDPTKCERAPVANCQKGFQPNPNNPQSCIDIDECSIGSPCQQLCSNSKGSYECNCRAGYQINERDPSKCDNIDECSIGSPCQQLCSNSKGSYECNCRAGYQINERDPSKCDIIDNCQKGYKPNPLNPTQCQDIDECSIGSPCQQLCSNSKGSYECNCRASYQINERDPSKCDIIDNCQKGYKPNPLNPTQCQDVDECEESNPCGQVCRNTAGGYVCSCRDGFQVSAANSSRCEEADKCRNNPCEHVCNNTISGYQCSCKRGYSVSRSDPSKCNDVNECSDSPCEHTCTNTQGSFRCSCRDGFAVDSNNKNKCTGVDACSTGRRCEHICTIISTGRKCSCKAGYVINEEDNTLCDEVEVCKTKADVILVFDASSSIGAEHFDKQFVFAKRLTSNFKLGPNDVRFGGIVYSRFPEKLFDLKDHSTLETLNKALSNVNYMDSSTYTHEAFLLIDKQQLFSVDKGGRKDAPDIVVLFTDGNPTFEDKAIDSAQTLKASGVLILGVAIGPALDLSVLKRITSTPSDALEASSYDTLDYIEKRLTQLLCDVSKTSQRIA